MPTCRFPRPDRHATSSSPRRRCPSSAPAWSAHWPDRAIPSSPLPLPPVRELLSGGLVVDGGVVGDGDWHERPLQPNDVAVITPHVEQAGAVAARLADLPGVLIGT